MKWINSAGGPLILLSDDLVGCWMGVTQKDGPSDYERACLCNDYLCILGINHGVGVVLGDEPLATTWIPSTSLGHPMLIRWVCANDEQQILAYASHAPDDVFTYNVVTYRAPMCRHLLFDSALAGHQLQSDRFLEVSLEPGDYRIDTGVFRPDADTTMVLHRFSRYSQ